ncbi:MAG: NhaP-type Na+/H+ or K+/H+ antiporter [Psychromonas sp.]|jgi:NhaP-type Na+/H+ or K+/H+ antiporter|uniref:cation:proton antiporter n=1 Tax=Psychromonas sp. TaxID=1884585 RepID=UPI0039E4C78B
MYATLSIFAIFVFFYSIASAGLEKTSTSGAIVFTAFGLLFGPLGLGLIGVGVETEILGTLAELTLAILLFTDASNANLGVLKRNIGIPRRLLLIGLPMTILLGYGLGVLIFDQLALLEVALLATMLAPTDAALGKAVVTNENVPANIREGLNVESGLNDGICVPIIFILLALLTGKYGQESTTLLALTLLTKEIGIAVIVGGGFAFCGGHLLHFCMKRDWVTETWQQLPVLTMALACFSVAQWVGGSGFIASFIGGLVFGSIAKDHKHKLLVAAEGMGDTLALITWVVFGALVIGPSIESFSWNIILYSVLSLTLIRMLPVFLVLTGQKLRTDEKLFIGWFGPRGLASIVFALIVIKEQLPGGNILAMTVACTVILSILAHGLSANGLITKLVARISSSGS